MQRYLATKHQHLKKASEQLLANRPSEFRQSLNLVVANSAISGNLPPYQHPPKPITTTVITSTTLENNLTTSHTSIPNTISSTNSAVELTKLTSSKSQDANILEDQVTKDSCNNAVADIPSVSQQGKLPFNYI